MQGSTAEESGEVGMFARKVKDIMLSLNVYATVSCEASIREALMALSKSQLGLTYDRHHHRAVLALDENGNVVGKLTHWAILRSLEPSILSREDYERLSRVRLSPEFIRTMVDRLYFTLDDNLELLCEKAARVKVKDSMVPVEESLDEEASLTYAIRFMVTGHWQSALVTRGDKVVGILRLSDVFEEVAALIQACQ
jgi:CBS domain-containing protein